MKIINLPTSVDLRRFSPNVESQSSTNACIAERDIESIEILLGRAGIQVELSRAFHYWNIRVDENEPGIDNGAKAPESHKTLMKYGVCPESVWPFDVSRINVKPSPEAYAAASYRISGCETLQGGAGSPELIQLMQCWLARGYPIKFAADVHPMFGMLKASALEETPAIILRDYIRRDPRAFGHAMLIVGYIVINGVFHPLVKNSWGSQWSVGGYFLAPPDWLWAYGHDFQVDTGVVGATLPDLWVPEYEVVKPAPVPVKKKHTATCKLFMLLGRKCRCGASR